MVGVSSVDVTLGAHNLKQAESTQQKMTATDIRLHPNYDFITGQNDVALIKLPTAAKLNGT